jgi:hypothetical protein
MNVCYSGETFRASDRTRSNGPTSLVRSRLACCLSMLLYGATLAATPASASVASPDAPQTWVVQTCDDTVAPGAIRYIAAHAQTGDTIDFSQLPVKCGMTNSTITLTSGEIVLHQPNIYLVGPAPGAGTVTLSGNGASRVLRHQIYNPYMGTLQINNLRFADGYDHAAGATGGGCIFSDANVVTIVGSTVTGCTTDSVSGKAYGGGIDAPHAYLSLLTSTVSGNSVRTESNYESTFGGGTYSLRLSTKYSEIADNQVHGPFAQGGGIHSGSLTMVYTTVANNTSDLAGGGALTGGPWNSLVMNSTFSGNRSIDRGGALYFHSTNYALTIRNSTIAFNTANGDSAGGVAFNGATFDLESTIVANNVTSLPTSGVDIYLAAGTLTGASNIVMSTNTSPPGVIALNADPRLSPVLSWIGGPTRALGLLPGSPAIGIGNNVGNAAYDQRGPGYLRATGPMTTVDVGAVQYDDTLFISDFEL